MTLRWMVLSGLLAGVLTACSAASEPGAPPAGRLPLEVESYDLAQMESYPVQLLLHVEGMLPNPCTSPAWEVEGPGSGGGAFVVELYAVPDGSEACIQVLAPFEVNIPLGSASGEVRVLLNGEEIADLTLP